jgi:hypothetical protein
MLLSLRLWDLKPGRPIFHAVRRTLCALCAKQSACLVVRDGRTSYGHSECLTRRLAWPAGTLFRAYPGPWQVLRGTPLDPSSFRVIHTQDEMPTLKQVALDILPRRRA